MKQTNYPVGDFLIRLKNAALAGNKKVVVGKTKLIARVARVLKQEGYLEEVKTKEGNLEIDLKVVRKTPVLSQIKLISKPGLRRYISVAEIEKHKGPSFLIISTSKGVMTSSEAIKKQMGGEVIAEIY